VKGGNGDLSAADSTPRWPSRGWVMVRVGEGDENGNGTTHVSCCC